MSASYIDIIARSYPGVTVSADGDGRDYDTLVAHEGQLPPKAELDALIRDDDKRQAWLAIQAERDRRKAAGIKVGDDWFHSDDMSRIQHLGLVMFGQSMPAGIMWKTMTGTFVQMTPALAQSIFTGIAVKDTQIFAVAEQHRQNMLASPDPAAYDYSSGWPLVFGE